MQRNLSLLSKQVYDLVIVGGGIFGACAAWDAATRGLSVALVERADFGGGTSAHSLKMVHGGIRYLQHADLVRVRESIRERNALLRIAPHLVSPLPIVIPTYGHGLQSKALLRSGLLIYDLLAFDRNRGIADPDRRIPPGRPISREECLRAFPHLPARKLTGAALFCDGQIYNPPRLVLSFLQSAVEAGAVVANYAEAIGLLQQSHRVQGVTVRDTLGGETFPVRGKIVLNATGPWAEHLLQSWLGLRLDPRGTYSRDACFLVARPLVEKYALAIAARTRDPDALLSRGKRHLFIAPWRDRTLIGVWHTVHEGRPDDFRVTEQELLGFLDEVNEAYPPLQLTLRDVALWNAGLVPFGENRPGATDLSYGKRSRIVDHAQAHSLEGLVTLIGVRLTTARGVARKVVDGVFRKLGKAPPKSLTHCLPIHGGRIGPFEEFLGDARKLRPDLAADVLRALARNHGSELRTVLDCLEENPAWARPLGSSTVLGAEVVHAVRREAAQMLGDVVFRRTDLGTGGNPGEDALRACAELMGAQFGWNAARIRQELAEVEAQFPSF